MNEQLISFETAKLAKENGFDGTGCTHCYDPHNPIESQTWSDNIGCSTEERLARLIDAPSQSLLQKWLREEHNIHVIPRLLGVVGWNFTMIGLGGRTISLRASYQSKKDTYEEALEAGLQEALKILKNTRN